MIVPLLIALLGQALPQRDTRPVTAGPTGAIVGVVTTDEAQPRPLRRARVMVAGAAVPRAVITSDDGSFAIERLPPGRYTVTAAKEGFVTISYGATRPARAGSPVSVTAQQSQRIAIKLPRGAVITGTVLDVDGQPAPGLTVSVLSRRFQTGPVGDYTYALAGTPSQATTDDRGVYRIFGLAAGDYLVAAQPTTTPGTPPGSVGSVVQMMSRGAISPRRMLMTQTFHPGTADLSRASRVTLRAGEERSGVDVQLEYIPLANVTGSVNLPPGFGVARVTLWRTDELARSQTGPVTSADAAGRFSFPAVAPGQYRVTARATPPSESSGTRVNTATTVQYAIADVTVNGEDLDVPMTLQPALSISGRIVFETEGPPAAAGLPVQLRLNIPSMVGGNGGWPLPPLVIDGTTFRLDGIIPGSYRSFGNIQAVRAPIGKWWFKSLVVNGRDLLDAPVDLQSGTDAAVATLTDRVSELAGVVTDAQGAPVGNMNVVAFTTDRRGWFSNSRRVAAVRTGPTGQYLIRNLPPGEYRVLAAIDLEQNEWFDPAVLERLLASGTPLTIDAPVRKTVDLRIK